ncbi:hypothetical protein GIB67_004060 [Kingdonia uniflora]|uniref:Uncharacterized protein n=1 Tax=Kingdonia uniflora TaxID=39325 RepID=A0A7J7NRW7_9MAGN|nr:hypothetical protein GIB67_004060 [Kingdonia uniflora]
MESENVITEIVQVTLTSTIQTSSNPTPECTVETLTEETLLESFLKRRSSVRLIGKKRPFYGNPVNGSYDDSSERERLRARRRSGGGSNRGRKNMSAIHTEVEVLSEMAAVESAELVNGGEQGRPVAIGVGEGVGEIVGGDELSAHARVKETVRRFNKYYLHFVQEEEQRCKKVKVKVPKEDKKRSAKRPDLKAATKASVHVGYQFYSRAEMVVVGLHTHWLKGIDYMTKGYGMSEEYKDFVRPLALSIVMSGVYEDDVDNLDEVVYTGEGGNNLRGNKRQIGDQEMVRGNLALKNNIEQNVPVRVIRGHGCKSSYVGKVYTYDGLYKVTKYWAEKGNSGFTVFKFRLRRLEGQPVLTTNQVQCIRVRAPKSLSEVRGLVCDDISGGQERIPVPATNLVDDPAVAPSGKFYIVFCYSYCKSVQVRESMKLPVNATGCGCKGDCNDPKTCACAKLNGSVFPYVQRDGGRLIEAKSVVFECGPNCGCGPGCGNKISQRGLLYRLEVFRTPQKGWAVKSWDFIPSGAPVCEYTGVLKQTDEIDGLSENKFIFEIDCLQTMEGLDGRERRLGNVSINLGTHFARKDATKAESWPEFCIDAGPAGGVARFINHSCEPNLFVQCVLSSHHDLRLARVMLFAADNIPPLQELTYDYGYALDSVLGPDGKIEILPCYCGATGCRKRLH